MGFSIWHWLIVLVIVLVLFGGGGKLSRLMGDLARGVNAFRKGLKETDPNAPQKSEDEAKAIPAAPGTAPFGAAPESSTASAASPMGQPAQPAGAPMPRRDEPVRS